MTITYKEFRPSAALQPYVDNYWFQVFNGEGNEESPIQKCLPLGAAQIIFHTNRHDCYAFFDGDWRKLPDAFFVGIYKDAVRWKTSGYSVCFGITLKPESLMHLFKIPASTLFNNYIDIDSFLGHKMNSLSERMFGVEDPLLLLQMSENFLLQRVRSVNAERSYLDEATKMIRQSKGTISIENLSRNLYVSERQLQRMFKDTLGTSPKTYTRIIRFRTAYEYLQQAEKENLSLIDITYNCGYADQAHFIRDFKEFTGTVPTNVFEKETEFYQLSTINYNEPLMAY